MPSRRTDPAMPACACPRPLPTNPVVPHPDPKTRVFILVNFIRTPTGSLDMSPSRHRGHPAGRSSRPGVCPCRARRLGGRSETSRYEIGIRRHEQQRCETPLHGPPDPIRLWHDRIRCHGTMGGLRPARRGVTATQAQVTFVPAVSRARRAVAIVVPVVTTSSTRTTCESGRRSRWNTSLGRLRRNSASRTVWGGTSHRRASTRTRGIPRFDATACAISSAWS